MVGLGTKLPWDEKFVIESLSDSTLYMAYYTISHLMQGDIYGSKPGKLGIKHEDVNDACFDYIYLDVEYDPETMNIPEEKLSICKQSF